jgi:hypothetical protein
MSDIENKPVKKPRAKKAVKIQSDVEELVTEEKPVKPSTKKSVKKQPDVEQGIKWNDLYFIISQAGVCFLRSLSRRDDIPDDALDIIRGVITLNTIQDGCVVEDDRLTAEKALWWADELKQWATNQTQKN